MDDELKLQNSRVVSATELETRISRAHDLSTAKNILDTAREAVKKTAKLAERDNKRQRDMMRCAAKRELSKELAETRHRATAMAVHEVLINGLKIHEKFDALSPWIEDLVETCLRRILGTIPDPDILKLIATEAITQNRRELKYIMRTGTDTFTACTQMVRALESTSFAGLILDVDIDRNLEPSSVVLTSSDGAIDISVETQLRIVRQELSTVLGLPLDAV